MKNFFKLLSISVLFVSLLILPLQAAGTIKIGVVLPITGPVATFGVSCTNGIKLAVEEINARGGVLGSKIELVIEDDQYKPEEAANATRKLIERDKIVALIGEATSSITLVIAPIAQQSKIVLLTPTATNPKVTQVGDYIFRTCFIDDFQGEVMANFIYNNLKKKTAAIFTAVTSDYSRGLASAFKQKLIALGGKIVAEESYSEGDSDFRAQLTKIKAAKPDFVYLPGYYSDIGPILLQARELGITVPFGGGDGWDSPILVQTAGKTAEGCFFTNHYSPESKDLVVKTFVNSYSKKYGSTPESFGALGYDSLKLLADAIKRAGSTESAKIRDALAATKGFKGVSGTITFDANRNPIKSAAIIEIKDGKQAYKATVKP